MNLDSKVPEGPLSEKWHNHLEHINLVSPNNKRKHDIIVVGTGLAGASAAASLAELGYNITNFCIQDSARRAHSIAAQGGINAAKNYPNDGDTIWRLFYDTIKGGDYRSRESNTYRLAQISNEIIDQAVAQGVPFAREYGGLLANRSFGGVQVSRTFYARGQTGQQLLMGAYQAMMRQVHAGKIDLHTRHEMLDLVVVDGKARGIVTRDLVTGEIERWMADAVVLCSGGYGNIFYLSTNAKNSNVTAAWRCHKRGAAFGNPCYVQIHPTCIPVSGHYQSKLTLMSESLRNDGRVWVPKDKDDDRDPNEIPEEDRWYYLEDKYPSFGNLVPRDVASRNAKLVCDEGMGVGKTGRAVYLDFSDAIERDGRDTIEEKYGNLFEMYENITDENPYEVPMRIFPAVHYVMGGLWVDYNLMSTIPGLFVAGEANFSDHGANRLGASALMQGLSDGYFIIPYTIGNYLADADIKDINTEHEAFDEASENAQNHIDKLLNVNGDRSVIDFHQKLGEIMWNKVGISRDEEGLKEAIEQIRDLREEFWTNVRVPGNANNYNKYLEFAGRVADFLELGELMAKDALHRDESCGCHFREEHQTEKGEALRNDEDYSYVAAWEYKDVNGELEEELHKENLEFEFVELKQRSYE
ncbi:MAG TPA: fumarate reductase/succinate dehydrogenase flavoprotein subunit [Balneolaceae bacterium]|nr:fumarate reductase/succinate dehydrogenase flavoprotein subunit [Balneolaceae bacterium]